MFKRLVLLSWKWINSSHTHSGNINREKGNKFLTSYWSVTAQNVSIFVTNWCIWWSKSRSLWPHSTLFFFFLAITEDLYESYWHKILNKCPIKWREEVTAKRPNFSSIVTLSSSAETLFWQFINTITENRRRDSDLISFLLRYSFDDTFLGETVQNVQTLTAGQMTGKDFTIRYASRYIGHNMII